MTPGEQSMHLHCAVMDHTPFCSMLSFANCGANMQTYQCKTCKNSVTFVSIVSLCHVYSRWGFRGWSKGCTMVSSSTLRDIQAALLDFAHSIA